MKKQEILNLQKLDLNAFGRKDFTDCEAAGITPEIIEKAKEYEQHQYAVRLSHVAEGKESYWVAEHPELPGCKTHGATREKTLANLDEARVAWIEAMLSSGEIVPKPEPSESGCSGKILVRIPKTLHQKIVQRARADEVSINQEINYLITSGLGRTGV